jgi:hypothetical protein
VNIELITTSEIRITCLIDESQVPKAVRALHKAFELEGYEGLSQRLGRRRCENARGDSAEGGSTVYNHREGVK